MGYACMYCSGNTKSRLSSGISINTSSPYRPLKKPSLIPFLERLHASTRRFFSSSLSEEKQLHFSGKFTSHPRTPFSFLSSLFPLLLVRILVFFVTPFLHCFLFYIILVPSPQSLSVWSSVLLSDCCEKEKVKDSKATMGRRLDDDSPLPFPAFKNTQSDIIDGD